MKEGSLDRSKLLEHSSTYYSFYICLPISTIDSINLCLGIVILGLRDTSLSTKFLVWGIVLATRTGFSTTICF